jgi:hypothetical protein
MAGRIVRARLTLAVVLGAFATSEPTFAAAPSAASAPPDPAAAPATTVSGIEVVAPARMKSPSRAAVNTYVGSLGVTALTGQLATWSRTSLPSASTTADALAADAAAGQTICPLVLGLPAANADFIVARIRQVGTALGAPMSTKPCPAQANNVIIVFPDDAAAFVRDLADDKPQAFGFRYHAELVRDQHKPLGPIRAWYGVRTLVTEPRFSRISLNHQSVIFQVLIVVDRDKTEAINMGQLSDYLAMISLAEVKPEKIPPTAPSILNLFNDIAAGRAPREAMTRMDAAYLQALYAIGPRQPGEMQESQIAERILRSLAAK